MNLNNENINLFNIRHLYLLFNLIFCLFKQNTSNLNLLKFEVLVNA